VISQGEEALKSAAAAIREGYVVATKGIGGFHLMVSGISESAIDDLRERKCRPAKPLALIYGNIANVIADCQTTEVERRSLMSPQAQIVLMRRVSGARPAGNVAPENALLGVMLPSNPLHHILLSEVGGPVVATSGNISDEPICTGNMEAAARLHEIADYFSGSRQRHRQGIG